MRAFALLIVALLGVVALGLPGCSSSSLPEPEYFEEVPVESDTWVPIDGEPDWVAAPPSREGSRIFVEMGRSNLRHIVVHGRSPLRSKFIGINVTSALTPLIGAEPAAVTAADVLDRLVMLERACKEEVLTERAVPGNTLCTAWALWELPLGDAVSTVPEEHRAAARELLATMDLTSRPQ